MMEISYNEGVMMEKVVIVGGSAAGMSAASRAKRTNQDLDITVFEKSRYVSYGPCGIPYYFEGLVKDLDDLVYYPAEYFREKRNIDVRNRHLVVDIDSSGKSMTAIDLEANREVEVGYDKLVLATGGEAFRPPIDGIDLEEIHSLRTLEDAERLYEKTRESEIVGVVGAGYIGLEMTEAFVEMGKKVMVFEMLGHVMPNMDETVTKTIEEELDKHGIELHLSEAVEAFEGDDRVETIVTERGSYPVDLVLLSAGVRPNTSLAENLGLDLGVTNAVKVNEFLKTSDPDVYAAGDNVETMNLVSGSPTYAPLAPAANKMGRTVGDNLATEDKRTFPGVVGTAITKIFDLNIARTGLTLTEAEECGFDAVAVDITHGTRGHYYPDSREINVRLVACKETHRILGGQLTGSEGVAGRVNTLAAVITNHMKAEDLSMLDLAYAPPFAPVWDSLTVAANVIQRKLR
jgi:NADPH-dependent 2,4-dienoyl-CoA reductase/sulfur reductase-like enzyme